MRSGMSMRPKAGLLGTLLAFSGGFFTAAGLYTHGPDNILGLLAIAIGILCTLTAYIITEYY